MAEFGGNEWFQRFSQRNGGSTNDSSTEVDASDYYSSNNPSAEGSASNRKLKLIRAEWADYEKRFQPYDKKLIGLATGDADNNAAIARSRAGVSGSFDVAQGTLQRNQQRLGLSSAGDELDAQAQNTAMAKTAAEVSAVNGTRLHAADRDLSLMAGNAAAGLKSGRLSGG